MTPRARSPRRRGRAGITLFEVLITSAIMAMMALMIYTAFEHTGRVARRLGGRQEQDHLARTALNMIARDIRCAFLSAHVNPNPQLLAVLTAFVGRDQRPGDRLDLTTFTHRRLTRGTHEGDAHEVGYRVEARRGDSSGANDLLRRESPRIDNDPLRGGTVDLLVPDVRGLEIRYFDNASERWTDSWDSTQGTEQAGRLPARVRVTLTMRDSDGRERQYMTETAPMIQEVLRFGIGTIFN